MHSNIDGRFKENQQEYSVTYNYFVNSENENDILSFLNYYEEKILILKENGNKNYIDYLYSNPKMKKIFETSEGLIIDNQRLNLRDILFVVMDKRKNNSDYYYFFYIKNEEIIQSSHSIKPPSSFKYPSDSFNSIIESLSFIEGTLLDGQKEKFKINPLWISSINVSESTIKLFSPNSLRYQIRFDKLEDNFNEFIDQDSIDKFFL